MNELERMISEVRDDLHLLAERFNYDLQNEQVINKSIELDKLLNLYNIKKSLSLKRQAK